MTRFFFPYKDIKSNEISKRLIENGVLVDQIRYPIFYPLFIFFFILQNKKPSKIFFRYLNDYKSFSLSVLILISEYITLILCRILRIDVYWICHNIDKETIQNHSKLTLKRRKNLVKFTKKIFVTSELLLEKAAHTLKVNSSKLDYISFGISDKTFNTDQLFLDNINQFYMKNKTSTSFFCLIVGSANDKTKQYEIIPEILKYCKTQNIELYFIIIGYSIETYYIKNNPKILDYFKKSDKILYLYDNKLINEKNIVKYADFMFRVYTDFSVPFSIFDSVKNSLPILTMNFGFIPEIVSYYNIGEILTNDFSNLLSSLIRLKKNQYNFTNFINNNNWEITIDRILAN